MPNFRTTIKMKLVVHPKFKDNTPQINQLIAVFPHTGQIVGKDDRNKIKHISINGFEYNIKSFKIPHIFNQIIYRIFRKSKARRSYEYAQRLLSMGISTPQPIAYQEESLLKLFLRKSYYISEHVHYDWTFRDLRKNPQLPNHELIIRQFTRFTHQLHEHGVHFLDHSSGNTLIIEKGNGLVDFMLVDLNRMRFRKKLSINQRLTNFCRLTSNEAIIRIMSDEYAKLVSLPFDTVFKKMNDAAQNYRQLNDKRKQLINKLKK
jgi:hypothetical protein